MLPELRDYSKRVHLLAKV